MPTPYLAGLLRDGEGAVGALVEFAQALREELPDLEVFVFENNSSDRTPELLANAAADHAWLHARSEVWDLAALRESGKGRTWDNKPSRLELIAAARNALLDWIRTEHGLAPGDRLIVIDYDFREPPPAGELAGWVRSMPQEADVLAANGVDANGRYYDLYEVRTHDHPLGPEIMGDRFWHDRRRRKDLNRVIAPDEPLIPVHAAFGGLTIYRADAIGGCRYSALPHAALHAYYRERFERDRDLPEVKRVLKEQPEKVHEGVAMGAHLFDDEVFYRNNSGWNFPVVAEHVNLQLEMRARVFIVPSLLYFSHH